MKRAFLTILATLAALACTAPAAFAKKAVVIFDPPPDLTCQSNTPCSIGSLDATYVNDWMSCSDIPGLSPDLQRFQDCLWFENDSGSAANLFSFGMTITSSNDAGVELECGASPGGIATWSCPNALPSENEALTTTFFATPSIQNGMSFILAIDGFDGTPGTPSVVASVPEPGVLGIFGLGLIGIAGAYWWKRRRQRGPTGKS